MQGNESPSSRGDWDHPLLPVLPAGMSMNSADGCEVTLEAAPAWCTIYFESETFLSAYAGPGLKQAYCSFVPRTVSIMCRSLSLKLLKDKRKVGESVPGRSWSLQSQGAPGMAGRSGPPSHPCLVIMVSAPWNSLERCNGCLPWSVEAQHRKPDWLLHTEAVGRMLLAARKMKTEIPVQTQSCKKV